MRFELTTLRVLDRTLYPLSWMIILHEIDATYRIKRMLAVRSSYRAVGSMRGCRLGGWCSCGLCLWSPSKQLIWYSRGEYVPDATTCPLPHFWRKLRTIRDYEVLKTVSARPCKLLIIWEDTKTYVPREGLTNAYDNNECTF